MPDSKITALTSISTSTDPANDPLVIVDVSDTSMAATGTTKKVTLNQLLGASGTATLASATITGDLTVDTSTLKVDSANNRVGIGTATPTEALEVSNGGNIKIGGFDQCILGAGGGGAKMQFSNGANDLDLFGGSTGRVRLYTASTERYRIASDGVATWSNVGGVAGTAMTLNANGLGIGVTPSAWGGAGVKVLDVGAAGSFAGSAADVGVVGNAYYNGTGWIYKTSFFSGRYAYALGTGQHQWFTAPSGTAGNAITFTQAMTLDSGGRLLVGTTNQIAKVSISYDYPNTGIGLTTDSNSAQTAIQFNTPAGLAGYINTSSTTTTYNSASDYRLKESVQPLVGGLARVSALKPSIYKWKADGSSGEGFLAHELAEVVPAAVSGEKDAVNEDGSIKPQGVDMSRVVPILVAAIQELTARVQTLETR